MNTDIKKATCKVFRTIMKGYKLSAFLTMTGFVLSGTVATAAPATALWVGGDSSAPNDPTVLANWAADSSGTALSELPGSTTLVTNNVIDETRIPIIEDGMALSYATTYIGINSGNSGKTLMTGGTLNAYKFFTGLFGGTGEFEQRGGTVTIHPKSNGVNDANGHTRFGRSGIGTLTITGGTYTATIAMTHIGFGSSGQVADGVGTITVGGDAVVSLRGLYVGICEGGSYGKCKGTLNISDNGSLTLNDGKGAFYLATRLKNNAFDGSSNDQRGDVYQSGGTFKTAAQYIGATGGARYTQTGGTNTANGAITLASGNAVVAEYLIGPGELFANGGIILAASGKTFSSNQGGALTLNEGGIVTTTQIQRGTSSGNHFARVVCNGGKLVAKENHSSWLQNLEFTYNAGGVTIDTKTYTVTATGCTTYSSAAEGSAVHKTGTGTLKYSALPLVDEIAVEEGTMAITANADVTSRSANVVSVASGAAFDCCGYTLAAQNLSGAGVVSNGTVTVAGTLSPDGTFAFGDATAVTVDGTLELAANETITLGAGATLDLTNATIKPPSRGSSGSWTFAMGGVGSITGTPKVAKGTGYCVEVAADGSSARLYRSGLIILFK